MPFNQFQNATNVPFFILDLYNDQLITCRSIPLGTIRDTKQIIYSETPIPGLNFSPVQIGGMGNRHLSFTLPLLKRDNEVGNVLLVKQFENLRNQGFGFNVSGLFGGESQFVPNPKVLFGWGSSNSVPLEFFVVKCEFEHRSAFVNRWGLTQYSEVSLELVLDETSPLYKAEEMYRKIASILYQTDRTGDMR